MSMDKTCKRAAFFDVDGTLLRISSMFDFLAFLCEQPGRRYERRLICSYSELVSRKEEGTDRLTLNELYYRHLKGIEHAYIQEMSTKWLRELDRRCPEPWIAEVTSEISGLRAEGYSCVFVSGSFDELMHPLGQRLGADLVIASTLDIDCDGLLTGELKRGPLIGEGKADAVAGILDLWDIDASMSVAYGDHITDLPMMCSVGKAVVVGDCVEMGIVAHLKGWRVIQLETGGS